MYNRSTGSPFGDTMALLAQPAALLGGLALAAAQLSRSYAMATLIARARAGGGYQLLPIAGMAAGIVMFVVFAIVHFVLSRRLGGPEDSEGEPGIGNWIALMFLFFLVSQLASFITPLMLRISGTAITNYPYIMGSISLAVRLVFFPVMVFLAALAHDGEAGTFGDIWSFLTGRGIGWLLGYVLLGIAVSFIPIGLMTALAPHPGSAASSAMLLPSLAIALGQLLPILYAIAAYRAARASKGQGGPLSF